MSELRGHSILIVVDGEMVPQIGALQVAIEDEGADVLVAGDHPDLLADTLATFDFTAAVVSSEQQATVEQLSELGYPLLVGASRKRFLGRLLADADGTPRPFSRCDDATVAVTALAARAGAWCVRVHEVGPNADAVRVAAAWKRAGADI